GANGTVLDGRTLRNEVAEVVQGARLRVGPLRFVVRVEPGVCPAENPVADWLDEEDAAAEAPRPATTAAPLDPEPETETYDVETGSSEIEGKVIQGILV